MALVVAVTFAAISPALAQGFSGGGISRQDYEACQAREENPFREVIERITVKALTSSISGLDYHPIVAEAWRKGNTQPAPGAAPGAAGVPALAALGLQRGVAEHAALVAEELQEIRRTLGSRPVRAQLGAARQLQARPELRAVELADHVAARDRAAHAARAQVVLLTVPAPPRVQRQRIAQRQHAHERERAARPAHAAGRHG